ncbi:MAG: sulfite exporter TauE/SafE family protein [Candidatus Aureabacteria bacterium]|nr:sulfite exporter TauE/SafE family protein [Candidatus Auribacterota bacterium]
MIQQFIDNLESYLHGAKLLAFLAVYFGGVLVSFTPCVYPVIPITVAYIGGRAHGSKMRGFLLSVIYVLGMSLTYAVLGCVAALTGTLFGRIQTSPWTYLAVGNVCILLGLSMLDVFMLPVPRAFSRLRAGRGQGVAGAFLVGAVSGLVVGPCTAPVLAVLLAYVAKEAHPLYGVTLLFLFAFGMGTLQILLGTFSGLLSSMPRAGVWMVRIKHLFGWILILIGEYFLVTAGTFLI